MRVYVAPVMEWLVRQPRDISQAIDHIAFAENDKAVATVQQI